MISTNTHSRTFGHSLVEASFGLVLIYVIGIAIVDVGIAIYAISLNDSVCRNAAAFAASGNPKEAERRARLVIGESGSGFGKLISTPEMLLPPAVTITSEPLDRRDPDTDKLINPGGPVTGSVNVRTRIEVRPFAVDVLLRHQSLVFESSQSFPIHYNMPPG